MKHKRFNEVYAYTYYIKCKITGRKYHGVRYANIKRNLSPNDDFAKKYFTSGKLHEDFKNNTSNYNYRLCATFDTIEEARDYESRVNTKLMYKTGWEVWNNSKAIYQSEEVRIKIGNSNRGKKRSAQWIVEHTSKQLQKVVDGTHYWKSEPHSVNTSKRMKHNNPSKDGLSDQHKKKIGDSLRGISKGPQTEQHRLNSSLAHKGQKAWNRGLVGVVKASDVTKEKMRQSKLGKKRGKYNLKKTPNGTSHLQGKKACCICCKREWDLGNLAKHLRKQNEI